MIGQLGSLALAAAALRRMEERGGEWEGDMPLLSPEERANEMIVNLSEEELAEREAPVSRQVRRQMERLRRKGRI